MAKYELAVLKGILNEIVMKCKLLESQINKKSIEEINLEINILNNDLKEVYDQF